MKDKSKLTAICLVIVTVIVVIGTYIYNKMNDKNDQGEINLVTNYSNFFTVNSCVSRVITHISEKNADNLLLLLDDKYEKDNNIDKNNVIDLFGNIEENSTFAATNMYSQNINTNITKYYVEGNLEKSEFYNELIQGENNSKVMYIIVYLDTKNKTYSIEPYDGELFKGGETLEK